MLVSLSIFSKRRNEMFVGHGHNSQGRFDHRPCWRFYLGASCSQVFKYGIKTVFFFLSRNLFKIAI